MVANGAGMNTYEPWEALVVGAIGGLVYVLLCWLFEKKKWDDALEAFQLHGGCGTAGVLCAPFFGHATGVFHDKSGKYIGYHIVCWIIFVAWSFGWSFIVFWVLNKKGLLRVDLKTEIVGYDFIDFADKLKFDPNRKIELKRPENVGGNIEIAYTQAPKTEA
jgi:Ammonia permease